MPTTKTQNAKRFSIATPAKSLDRRARRSRKLLSDALLALLLEKEYESISISDIAKEADLNRATFYSHYETKEELLLDGLGTRFDELTARIYESSGQGQAKKVGATSGSTVDTETTVADAEAAEAAEVAEYARVDLALFQHVAEHANVYRILLGPRGVGYVKQLLLDYITAAIEADFLSKEKVAYDAQVIPDAIAHALIEEGAPLERAIPYQLMARHIAGSLFSLMTWWIANDRPYSPQYMAAVAGTLCVYGAGTYANNRCATSTASSASGAGHESTNSVPRK